MNATRLILLLITLSIGMQATILYRQFRPIGNSGRRNAVEDVSPTPVDLSGRPLKGVRTAKVVLIEFSDFECPFCQRHAKGVAHEVDQQFVSTGKIEYAFVNNPLPNHGAANLLATAAICGGEQGRFWETYEVLFEKTPKTKEEIVEATKGQPWNHEDFSKCMVGTTQTAERIKKDAMTAKELGVSGTPSFALGKIGPDGRVVVTKIIRGAQPLTVFRDAINGLL